MEAFLGQCRWKPFKHRRRWTKLVPMPFFFKKISLLQYFTNFWSCSLVSIYNLPGVPIGLAQVKVRHRKNCDCCLWKKWQGPRQWQQQRQWQRKCWRLVTFETLVTRHWAFAILALFLVKVCLLIFLIRCLKSQKSKWVSDKVIYWAVLGQEQNPSLCKPWKSLILQNFGDLFQANSKRQLRW